MARTKYTPGTIVGHDRAMWLIVDNNVPGGVRGYFRVRKTQKKRGQWGLWGDEYLISRCAFYKKNTRDGCWIRYPGTRWDDIVLPKAPKKKKIWNTFVGWVHDALSKKEK